MNIFLRYNNDPICPFIFIKNKSKYDFTIIAMYIDDLNIIRKLEKISKTINYLKKKLEMKTKFYLSLQIEHLVNEFSFINQLIQRRFLKNFIWIKHIH